MTSGPSVAHNQTVVMKEETSQSADPLPTKPTMMEKEEKEEEEEQNLKEKANPKEGTLVVVEPLKKGGNCGMVGSGLLDLFLRLGFLKVVPAAYYRNMTLSRISHKTYLLLYTPKTLGHRIKS